jgi:hypothetical protein
MRAKGSREQQVPPLRYAPVGMTKGRVEFPARFDADGENFSSLGCAQDDDSVGEPTERRPLCRSRGALQVPRLRSG